MNKITIAILKGIKDDIKHKVPIAFWSDEETNLEHKLSNQYYKGQQDTYFEILKMINELIKELEEGGSNE